MLGGDVCFEDSSGGCQKKSPQENQDGGNVMPQSSRSSPKTKPKVIAAIPCFNTETFIMEVISKAKKYVGQVIIIDPAI